MNSQQHNSRVFELYAAYYDLLYRDKDYAAEAAFVSGRLRAHRPDVNSLLELGCGTGRHAAQLTDLGFTVTGVDRSEGMLEHARANAPNCFFFAADIRNLSMGQRYDAAISLFHVMSYQITDEDIYATLSCAAKHLVSGGLLLFDFWYGPAVLKTPPDLRVKEMSDDLVAVTRRGKPVHHDQRRVVDVHFTIDIREQRGKRVETLCETHSMRYFFLSEWEQFMSAAGFSMLESGEWMTGAPATADTWSAYCIARKTGK